MSTADLLESAIHQHQKIEPNEETHIQNSISSDGNYTEEVTGSKSNNHEILKKGSMQYGCRHYRRRCQIQAPCCNKIFDCRYCHNEAKDESNSLYLQDVDKIRFSAVECFRETFKNSMDVDTTKRREVPRHVVRQVVCSMCGTEQEVRQICINCGVYMGSYFCQKCKLFDNHVRCCYSNMLRNSHACVEGGMHHDCPICFEEMKEHCQFACPFCSKSVCESKACDWIGSLQLCLTHMMIKWSKYCAMTAEQYLRFRRSVPSGRAQAPKLQVLQHSPDLKDSERKPKFRLSNGRSNNSASMPSYRSFHYGQRIYEPHGSFPVSCTKE